MTFRFRFREKIFKELHISRFLFHLETHIRDKQEPRSSARMNSESRITPEAAEMQQANTQSHAVPVAVVEACSSSTCCCTLHGFSAVAWLVMVEHKANKV